ncbi:MAG: esterase-like activity of phytase family protein [Hyphomonadaceae bacterium]
MKPIGAAAAALLLLASACAGAQETPPQPAGWQALTIETKPAPISQTAGNGARYGALIFRGGLELKAANGMFGGWSGLEIDKGGRITAVSDDGAFFEAKVVLDAAGDLTGLSDARIALMRGLKGEPLDSKEWQDAEDIARLPDGRYAVSFERHHRIWIYDLDGKGPLAGGVEGPAAPQDMGENEGLEALTATPEGDLIAGREFSADHKPPTQFFRMRIDGNGGWIAGPAQVSENYALVALRPLPGGDYLALERFWFPILGSRTELRRYKAAGLADARPHLDGPVLASLLKPLALDNFEGLAVTPGANGATRLYIISDDNFSASQRTLLYAFDLPAEESTAKGAPR